MLRVPRSHIFPKTIFGKIWTKLRKCREKTEKSVKRFSQNCPCKQASNFFIQFREQIRYFRRLCAMSHEPVILHPEVSKEFIALKVHQLVVLYIQSNTSERCILVILLDGLYCSGWG